MQYFLQDIGCTVRKMTKIGPELGGIRKKVGTVLERQMFALSNHCPLLRLFHSSGQNKVISRGTSKRIIRVLLMFLGCPLSKHEVQHEMKVVTKSRDSLF